MIGETATFSVVASGMAPLAYQWQRNGTNIAGATSSSYTTPVLTAADNGASFDVVVSNALGRVTSVTVILTVGQAPAFTSPAATTFTVGMAGSFTVMATGSPKPTISEAGALPAGVSFTAATGVLNGTPAAGSGGAYPITFTAHNGVGTDATQPFTLTVSNSGSTTLSVFPATMFFGQTALGVGTPAQVLTVTNTGTSTLNVSGVNVTGTHSSDFVAVNLCTSAVAPNGTCTITVVYTQTLVAPAIESATLQITSNASGSPQSVPLMGGGQFMAFSADKSHLVNTFTNQPVFITGEDAFSMIGQLSNADIEVYLADRAARGFNLIWIGAVDNTYSQNPPNNALGQAPFGGAPFTNMQEPYFAHLDYVIQRAGAYGITVLLNPAFSGFNCDDASGWCPELEAAGTGTLTAYGAYLGNRYQSYPNMMWLLGGDLNIPQQGVMIKNAHNAIALGIKSQDLVHLMTVQNIRGQAALDEWAGAPWLDLNSLYFLPTDFPSAANSNYQRVPFLPFFEMEDYYEGEHSMTQLQLRAEAYWAVLGGGYLGQFFGNNAIWNFGNPAYDTIGPWPNQLGSMGTLGRQYLGQLFRSREHWLLVPDIGGTVVTSCTPNCGTAAAYTQVIAARTSNGQTIVSYIPNGNGTSVTVNMSRITSSTHTVHAWWFNPRTGSATDHGTFANTGSMIFTPPDSNDWVLVLDDAAANLPAPGSADL